MKRGRPLRRCTPLRRTPLAPISKKNRAKESTLAKARLRVRERDRVCVVCKRPGTDVHHIVHRSLGGNHDDANLILLCRRCHNAAHLDMPRKWEIVFQYYIYQLGVDGDGLGVV